MRAPQPTHVRAVDRLGLQHHDGHPRARAEAGAQVQRVAREQDQVILGPQVAQALAGNVARIAQRPDQRRQRDGAGAQAQFQVMGQDGRPGAGL
jgi:hypothetical protein